MEIKQRASSSPSSKRRKLDNDSSLIQPMENTTDECPIMSLPIDLLSNIIARVPIAQRHVLELVDKNFREATLHAWRQLRYADLDDFLIEPKQLDDESTLERGIRSIATIIEKLNNRSPFLTHFHGVPMQTEIPELNLSMIVGLTRFEYLESISFGGGLRFTANVDLGCPIQDLNLFLETTRSRATLKELIIGSCTIDLERQRAMAVCIRRFSQLISDDRGMREPLKLDKLSIDYSPCSKLNFDFMDLSRMTELHFGTSKIKPEQLTSMIIRAANLDRLNFAFFHCQDGDDDCDGHGLRNNTDLLEAIASCDKLKVLVFQRSYSESPDETYHEICMRFESEFLDMLKALGQRGILEELTFTHDFVSPKFDMSRVIANISEYMPYLRSLTIPVDDCNAHDLQAIVKMEYLKAIEFLYNGDYKKFYDVTDGVFAELGSHKRLKRISLGGFAREHERPLEQLAKLSTLVDVGIRRVNLICKEEFVTWSEGYVTQLESLTLTGIGVLDKDAEVGLIALITKASRLRVLIIEGVITDRLLEAIAESCPKLVSLGVSSRRNEISLTALQKVVDNCPDMKSLGGMKNDVRKQLAFPKYSNMGVCCANPWSIPGEDDDDGWDEEDGLEEPDW